MSMSLRSMAIVLSLSLMTVAPAAQVARPVLAPPSGVTQDATGDNDRFDVDKMSSMGRFAHLLAGGRLEKAVAKARAARERVHGVAAGTPSERTIIADEEEGDDGFQDDEDFPDAPQSTQSETSIAVDASGQHVVIGYNDFRGVGLNPLSISGFMYSDDGGATFVDGGQLPVTVPTTSIGTTQFPRVSGDPDVKYVGGSTFVYFSIVVDTFNTTGTVQTMGLHRSTDFGHTWTGPYVIPPASNPNGLVSGANAFDGADKEYADVDPDTGRVMMSWTNFTSTTFAPAGTEISVTFSDDVLKSTPPTWSARRVIGNTINDGQASMPRFAGNGSTKAYVAWQRFNGLNNNVGFVVSNDNGNTWSAPLSLTSDYFTMDQVLGNDRVHSFPALAVDNSTKPTSGNIYVAYANNSNHDGADIAFQRSTNGGTTFSAPVLLNSRPGSDRAQFFPWLTVDDSTGRLYLSYYDQGVAAAGDLTEASYQYSDDGGLTWRTPANLDDHPFRAGFGNDASQPNLGDYNQAVGRNGSLYAVFARTDPVTFTDGVPTPAFTTPSVFFKKLAQTTYKVPLHRGSISVNDAVGGNGNSFIDPGEQIRFTIPLQHYVTNAALSPVALTGISATLTSTTPGVSITQSTSVYPTINPGASANNSTDFIAQISAGFIPFTNIDLQLNVTTNQGSTSLAFWIETGTATLTTFFQENFDATAVGSLPAGWTTSHAGGNNTVAWTTSNTFGGTGSNGAFHTNANDGAVVNNVQNSTRFERLFSPLISVPATAGYVTLDMDVRYDTQDDPNFNIQAFDGFLLRFLDASTVPNRQILAEAFAETFTTGGVPHYPKHFPRSGDGNYFQDMSAWAGDSAGVKHVSMKLKGMAGRAVQLRFEYTQNSALTCANVRPGHTCGVWFDNLVMKSAAYTLADVSMTKTLDSGPAVTGTRVSYSLTAANTGPTTASNVTVSDNLPPSLSLISCAAGGVGVCVGPGLATFTLEEIAAGTKTPFNSTNGGITASFSSPDGAVFSANTSQFSTLAGRILGDVDTPQHRLDISFSQPLQAISLVFAMNTTATGNSLTLQALNGTTIVGTVSAPALFQGNSFVFPEGSISFNGATFDNVRLTATAQDFAIDNVNVSAAGALSNNVTVNYSGIFSGTARTANIVAALSCGASGGSPLVNTATVTATSPDPVTTNNSYTASATILNPSPTISCPSDVTATAAPGAGSTAVSFASPTANDNCPLPPNAIVTSRASGSAFPIGLTSVTGTVTDSGGAVAQCSFNVSVKAPTSVAVSAVAGQYSDPVTLTATVSPSSFPGQTIGGSVAFLVDGNPVGSSPVNSSGMATLPYIIGLGQGSYNVAANFTSTNAYFLNSSGTGTLTVSREDAVVTASPANPDLIQVSSAGGAATFNWSVTITEPPDSGAGDITRASAVTFTLTPMGPGSVLTKTSNTTAAGIAGVTFTDVPVNVYELSVSIEGAYYHGGIDPVVVVYDPSLGFTSGGGQITRDGVTANFGYNFKYLKNGNAQGHLEYVEHRPSGDVKLKSNEIGSMAIVGGQAIVLGKGTSTVDGGNYNFRVTLIDAGEGADKKDQFGLQLTDQKGNVVSNLIFAPIPIDHGNIQVPKP